jgi:pimeloyl-ACP methyl ester carboxylesterase
MSRKRNFALGAAALVAGGLAGAALEEYVYRRIMPSAAGGPDVPPATGETVWVDAFDGTRIRARVSGRSSGPTIVFAHGVIESADVWGHQLADPVLADRYRLVAYDARGHGGSGPARGPAGDTPFTTRTQALDMAAVVEATASGRVVLVGHSMGGIAIQSLWDGEVPESIRKAVAGAVIVNSTFTAELAGWRGAGSQSARARERVEDIGQRVLGSERVVRRLRPGKGDITRLAARFIFGPDATLEQIEAGIRMYRGTPSATLAAAIDMVTTDLYDVLPRIDVPVLVVAGSRDRITPAFLSEEMASRIPGAELVLLERSGHMTPFERPEELNTHIAKFCELVL